MNESSEHPDFVPYVAHGDFRAGMPHGRFRVVINPALARPFVVRRMHINLLAVAVIGAGSIWALMGHPLSGLVLVMLGIAAHRLVRFQAGKIVLHLALQHPAVYAEVTNNGVMEVRRAA